MPRGEPQKNVEQQKRVRHGWESLCHVFVSLWKLKGRFLDSLFSSSSSPFRLWFIYVFIYLAVHISFLILTDLHSNCHLYSYTPPPPALVHTHYMVLPNSLFSFSWPFITYLGEEEKKNKVAGTIYTNFLFFKKSSSLWLIDSAFPARFVIEPTQQQGRGRGQRESQQTMETRKKSPIHIIVVVVVAVVSWDIAQTGRMDGWPKLKLSLARLAPPPTGTVPAGMRV